MKVDTVDAIEMEARRLVELARAADAPVDAAEVARRALAAFPQVAIEFLAVLEEYARSYIDECASTATAGLHTTRRAARPRACRKDVCP